MTRRLLVALSLVFAAIVVVDSSASAATTRFVDDDPGCDETDGIPYYCTIQTAIDASANGDTIQVAAGTYIGSGTTVAIIDGLDVTIVGAGKEATFISGEDTRRGILVVNSSISSVSNLTITDGYRNDSGGAVSVGSTATLHLSDVTVRDSLASFDGGGIFLQSSANLTLLRVEVTNNTANNGGGLYLSSDAKATITDSVFAMNDATNNSGGGIGSNTSEATVITGSRFEHNTATGAGGGIYMNGSVTITDSRFSGNSAANGGGLYTQAGFVTIEGSLFDENAAATAGGGLHHTSMESSTDLLKVVNTTFFDNAVTTGDGGGAYADGFFVNTTFSGNSAGGHGGGLAENTFGPVNVANSILAGNTAGNTGPDCFGVWSEGHNLVGDDSDGACVDVTSDLTGNLIGMDPLLAALADNGGPTMTMALPVTSPARNAGHPDAPDATDWDSSLDVAAGDWSCATGDQRGESRTETRCDMGAFEIQKGVVRYAGPNRYATAAAISANDFPNPGDDSTVFIATGLGFADGLAASAIAPWFNAPLLLVNSSGIPGETAAELTRLNPDRIYLFGGSTVIPDNVKFALEGYAPVARIAGNNRYATAIAISQLGYPGDNNAAAVFIATGLNFPDALAAAPAAYVSDGPVLLVPGSGNTLPADVAAEILRLEPVDIFVVGGTGAVSDAIFQALDALQVGDTVTRVSGGNRYETSANLAATVFDTGADRVYLATGLGFADTLAGGAAAGRYSSPILLVPGTSITGPVSTEITNQAPELGVVLGGTAVVTTTVENDLKSLIGAT